MMSNSKGGRRARNFRNAINMAAAVSQHGEVSARADSHTMVDSGLLITFLLCDSAFYAIRKCPQTEAFRNSQSGMCSRFRCWFEMSASLPGLRRHTRAYITGFTCLPLQRLRSKRKSFVDSVVRNKKLEVRVGLVPSHDLPNLRQGQLSTSVASTSVLYLIHENLRP